MTRRAIDIDDETWRQVKIAAIEHGITVKEEVATRLRLFGKAFGTALPPHTEVAGYCQRDGEAWPCVASQTPDQTPWG